MFLTTSSQSFKTYSFTNFAVIFSLECKKILAPDSYRDCD